MTAQLPLSEVLDTARQKLGRVSSCLNDSAAFAVAVSEFDDWLAGHKDIITHATSEQADCRRELESLIRELTRLEVQARYNVSLVTDMQGYIRGQLDTAPPLSTPYHR